jgi:hypothetical protein
MESPRTETTAWRAIYALVTIGLLVAFMLSVKAVLNPVLLFLLVVLVASPFAGERSHRILIGAAGLLTVVWLLDTLGPLLAPFFLALGLSYVLYPLVLRIERRGVSRGVAIGILALPVLALLALLALVGVPALLRQLGQLISRVPEAIQSLVVWVERMQQELARRDFAYVDESAVLERLRALQPEAVLQYLQARQAAIARNVWVAMTGAGRGLSFVLSLLGYLVLAPILGFYLLRDWEKILGTLRGLVPPANRPKVMAFAQEYNHLLAGYIRGALLAASIIGTLTFVAGGGALRRERGGVAAEGAARLRRGAGAGRDGDRAAGGGRVGGAAPGVGDPGAVGGGVLLGVRGAAAGRSARGAGEAPPARGDLPLPPLPRLRRGRCLRRRSPPW